MEVTHELPQSKAVITLEAAATAVRDQVSAALDRTMPTLLTVARDLRPETMQVLETQLRQKYAGEISHLRNELDNARERVRMLESTPPVASDSLLIAEREKVHALELKLTSEQAKFASEIEAAKRENKINADKIRDMD